MLKYCRIHVNIDQSMLTGVLRYFNIESITSYVKFCYVNIATGYLRYCRIHVNIDQSNRGMLTGVLRYFNIESITYVKYCYVNWYPTIFQHIKYYQLC